jgi:nitric oxide dioxygenase
MLSEQHRSIVRATVPVLQEYGEAITKAFYDELFTAHPELLNMFNLANQRDGGQARSLAASILSYAAHIDHLESLGGMVERIAHKHASLHVLPEQYPIVGKHLLSAIRTVLGAAATDEIIDAWAAAYGQLADIMIGRESDLYAQGETQSGGWSGYKPFRVQRKVQESDAITSFYLVPADGAPLPPFRPGQYLGVKFQAANAEREQIRQYSLSCAPNGEYYRISVKREAAPTDNLMIRPGVASNYLHDHIQVGDTLPVTTPFGDFTIDGAENCPLVLISGGVGITPVLSMLHHAAGQSNTRPIVFIHATLDRANHAFGAEIKALTSDYSQIRSAVLYEKPGQDDVQGEHYDHTGLLTADILKSYIPEDPSEFYYCGSIGFIGAVERILDTLDIPLDRRHTEAFAPDPSFVTEIAA